MDKLADTLCHYTTADVAFQHIIPSGQLRMSPYAMMRDPLENRELQFSVSGSTGEADDKLADVAIEAIRSIRDLTFLLSFTIDATVGYSADDLPFMRAWARARMWEQYAGNHTGVCIVFDRERARGQVIAHLHQIGLVTDGEVAYTPRGFANTKGATLPLENFRDEPSRAVAAFAVEHERDLLFTKTLDWQSEHEYRITVMPNDASEHGYVYVPFGDSSSVRAVILGERFPRWQIPAAKWACDQVGVDLLWLQWRAGLPWPLPAT